MICLVILTKLTQGAADPEHELGDLESDRLGTWHKRGSGRAAMCCGHRADVSEAEDTLGATKCTNLTYIPQNPTESQTATLTCTERVLGGVIPLQSRVQLAPLYSILALVLVSSGER